MDASVSWVKRGWSNGFYDSGFTNQFTTRGALYNKAANPQPPTNTLYIVGRAAIENSYGNLNEAFINYATITTGNKFSFLSPNINTQKLSIASSSGKMSGQLIHPSAPAIPTKIYGAILQDENVAGGFFLGTNQSSSIRVRQD